MADWSSLPTDIVGRVGDSLLATDDIDYYMDMRAVCRGWRSDTDDPKVFPAEPRFCLRRWVMLDERHTGSAEDERASGRLFLNTATGRFVRKELPGLAGYYFVTSAGGLLVLASKASPHAVLVVNPFTASSIDFMALVPDSVHRTTACLNLAGASPTLILGAGGAPSRDTAYAADPAAERFAAVEYGLPEKVRNIFGAAVVAVPGDIHSRFVTHYFIESGEEVFLVLCHERPSRRRIDVFKVDAKRKAIEPARSIGGRAIFLGKRCVAVDAGKFPSVDGDCVFYLDRHRRDDDDEDEDQAAGIYMYDLAKEEEEWITSDLIASCWDNEKCVPPCMVQLLVNYCTNIPWSQLAYELRNRLWEEAMAELRKNSMNATPAKRAVLRFEI